eukprot:gene54777-15439_t
MAAHGPLVRTLPIAQLSPRPTLRPGAVPPTFLPPQGRRALLYWKKMGNNASQPLPWNEIKVWCNKDNPMHEPSGPAAWQTLVAAPGRKY